MTAHSYHPDVWEPASIDRLDGPVLKDGCPRCAEHAEHPERTLDAMRQRELVAIVERGGPFRSELDRRAAGRLIVAGIEVRP